MGKIHGLSISFKERATIDPIKPLNDLLVVELTIQKIDVARILVDTGVRVFLCRIYLEYYRTMDKLGFM